jgi:hypothetical protein
MPCSLHMYPLCLLLLFPQPESKVSLEKANIHTLLYQIQSSTMIYLIKKTICGACLAGNWCRGCYGNVWKVIHQTGWKTARVSFHRSQMNQQKIRTQMRRECVNSMQSPLDPPWTNTNSITLDKAHNRKIRYFFVIIYSKTCT